jgi:hypothetical protein
MKSLFINVIVKVILCTHIGRTEGLFSKGIKLNGDGTFTARTRTDFLHTWHYAKEF